MTAYQSFLFSIGLFILIIPGLKAQSFSDRKHTTAIKIVMDALYARDKMTLEKLLTDLNKRYPRSPAPSYIYAMNILVEKGSFSDDTASANKYKSSVNNCVKHCEQLDPISNQQEVEFYMIVGYGSLAQYYGETGRFLQALGSVKEAYNYIEKGLDRSMKVSDLNFPLGMYLYHFEKFKENNPAMIPLLASLRSGDKQLGLKLLSDAKQHGVLTATEASLSLCDIMLVHEGQPKMALHYIAPLVRKYPNNALFKTKYLECIAASDNIDLLNEQIKSLPITGSEYFNNIFKFYTMYNNHIHDKSKQYDKYLKFYDDFIEKFVQNRSMSAYVAFAQLTAAKQFHLIGNTKRTEELSENVVKHSQNVLYKKEAIKLLSYIK